MSLPVAGIIQLEQFDLERMVLREFNCSAIRVHAAVFLSRAACVGIARWCCTWTFAMAHTPK
ncbi:hypothetical protein [Bradyrhizobium sp. USDA 329]|uniref:hypothetical protein n=1 Tax=unclassified Bradyrhizobium TaxID=2631580 RepID=UPI0035165A1E